MQVRTSLMASAVTLVLGAVAPAAWAGVHVNIGIDPFGIVTGPPPPVVYAPPAAYAPAPVYEPPPVVYVGGGHWGGPPPRRDRGHDRGHDSHHR